MGVTSTAVGDEWIDARPSLTPHHLGLLGEADLDREPRRAHREVTRLGVGEGRGERPDPSPREQHRVDEPERVVQHHAGRHEHEPAPRELMQRPRERCDDRETGDREDRTRDPLTSREQQRPGRGGDEQHEPRDLDGPEEEDARSAQRDPFLVPVGDAVQEDRADRGKEAQRGRHDRSGEREAVPDVEAAVRSDGNDDHDRRRHEHAHDRESHRVGHEQCPEHDRPRRPQGDGDDETHPVAPRLESGCERCNEGRGEKGPDRAHRPHEQPICGEHSRRFAHDLRESPT